MGTKVNLQSARRIAIVDDDDSVRESIVSLMESLGYRCDFFSSAEQLLNWRRLPETECLILDVQMPMMDGLELQSRLAAIGLRIPIVFITAHPDRQKQERTMKAGAVAFLHKPFSYQALLDAVHLALASSEKSS